MHRVMKRTWVMHVFVLVLLAGMAFFLWEYVTQAQKWVASTGSPHLYNNSNIGCGTIVDRSGTVLLDISTERSYAEDSTTRKSTLHWLGDRKGFISAAAVSNYADEMAGYDRSVVENKFPALFNAFDYGAPPHAGCAFGFDRLLMFLCNTDIIRDVIAFPLNKSAQDLMMSAPSTVTEQQLRDVSIKIDIND